MTIVRKRKDPRTAEQRHADERLHVSSEARRSGLLAAAAWRIRTRDAEPRREVARLRMEIAR
jgi:hypothetical protein